jgi:uncharacterized protein YkwD
MKHQLTLPSTALISSILMLGGLSLAQADNTTSLLELTNQQRQIAHQASLVWSDQLAQVAQHHAQDMANNRGSTVSWGEQIKATGYSKPQLGLIIAAGHSSAEQVLSFWMNSGNRIHLLDGRFTDVGIGYVYDAKSRYHHYWVMIFGGGQAQHLESRLEMSSDSHTMRAPSRLSATQADSHQMKAGLLQNANQNRQTALVFVEPLNRVAQRLADKMALSGLDSHLPVAQIKAAGYSKSHLGLIVAAGHSSPDQVIRYWMNSQSRTYLTDEKFSDVGIGYVYDSESRYHHYWVMIFGGGQAQHLESRLEMSSDSHTMRAPSRLSATQADSHQMKAGLLQSANQNRQTALVFVEPLNRVAQRLADKMALSGLDSHLPVAQIKAAGYSKSHLGLIVAAGHSSPDQVIRYWMNSQSRTYLTDEKFSDVGIGYVYDSESRYHHYWVMIFGGGQAQHLESRLEMSSDSHTMRAPSRLSATQADSHQMKASLLQNANQNRQTALVFVEPLNRVAQRLADKMALSGLDSHLPVAQIKAAGYSKSHLGLIVAAGHSSPDQVIRYWMNSQSRTYLTDEKFSDVGIGYVYDSESRYHHYWVMIFGGGQAQHLESRLEMSSDSHTMRAPSRLSATQADSHQMKAGLLQSANQNRQTALVFVEPLNRVAQRLADKMALSGLDSHLPVAQIKAAGYSKSHLGLIVAAGHSSPDQVIRYWMNSQSRTYLTDEKFSDVGIGYVYDSESRYHHYWVMIFGGGQP